MTNLYTIDWKKIPLEQVRKKNYKFWQSSQLLGYHKKNFVAIRVTCLDETGRVFNIIKFHEEWLGVCTENIDNIIREFKFYLPGINVRYEKLDPDTPSHEHVLPYFKERLERGQLENDSGPFYKVYLDCPVEDVGCFFRRYEIAYFHKCDWSIRLYIDFCTRYKSRSGFFYKWYKVDFNKHLLLDAFVMQNTHENGNLPIPHWNIAAFDIETVPGSNAPRDRIPDGMDPGDRIVMISVVKWNENDCSKTEEKVLYVNPIKNSNGSLQLGNPQYFEYNSESDMLNDFHFFINDCHVLTGYNINNFDIPCIFARLLFLGRLDLLCHYSSRTVGDYKIVSFSNKIVLDMYSYFRIFSNYDLSSFKLDEVSKTKLGGDDEDRKVAIDSVGIYAWYNSSRPALAELCCSTDSKFCYEELGAAERVTDYSKFGTFAQYLEYCLRDSQLVRRLFLKETTLSFLIARANFVALDVVQAMHYGNSRFLLELFQTYGTLLGFFVNVDWFRNQTDGREFESMFESGTYQGALNYCESETYFEDVAVLDFTSMYPISLLSANLCYGTCSILTTKKYIDFDDETKQKLTAIPYRKHSDKDFSDFVETYHHLRENGDNYEFRYPRYDSGRDEFVIVVNQKKKAFLPTLVEHFLKLRKFHQQEYKRTRDVIHYNSQLCIKILINSLYGTMASKESSLAYIVLAIAIVTLARYQLLGSYHYVKKFLKYDICYADTDSLMVHRWPHDHCDAINQFLDKLPYVEIKFEQRMKRLLILSKKRYIYETLEGSIVSKGFQKKTNTLVKFMSNRFVESVMGLRGIKGDPADGWILLVETLLQALYMCRDPKKYAVTRKTRKLSEYTSTTCTAVKILKRYPEKEGDYIDYTFSRADVAEDEVGNWVMSVEDCQYVNFEKLFVNQKKIFFTVLNIGYWNLKDPRKPCDAVLNVMHWKYFVHAELLNYFANGKKKKLLIILERGIKYTFHINDHIFDYGKKKNGANVRS